jgi:hypothetical protein
MMIFAESFSEDDWIGKRTCVHDVTHIDDL